MSTGGGNDPGQHHNPDHTSQPGTAREQFAWLFTAAHARASMTGPFSNFMRTRTAGGRCELSVLGLLTTLTAATATPNSPDPAAETACWRQLRTAMTAALEGDPAAGGMLPTEITSAEWDHHGQHTRIRHPGTTTRVLQCVQHATRRGVGAVTPLTIIGALSQPLIGGATAAGIALAPGIPIPHQPTAPAPSTARALTGDVWRPAPGNLLDAHPVTPVSPWPGRADERDTTPAAPTRQAYTPPPTVQRTTPTVNPAASTAPTVSPSPKPSPTTTGILDETSPTPNLTPTPTPTPPPISTRMIPHHQHKQHYLRHIPRWH